MRVPHDRVVLPSEISSKIAVYEWDHFKWFWSRILVLVLCLSVLATLSPWASAMEPEDEDLASDSHHD